MSICQENSFEKQQLDAIHDAILRLDKMNAFHLIPISYRSHTELTQACMKIS